MEHHDKQPTDNPSLPDNQQQPPGAGAIIKDESRNSCFQFQPQRGNASFTVRYREGSIGPNCLLCRD